jgi:hypothetical protein
MGSEQLFRNKDRKPQTFLMFYYFLVRNNTHLMAPLGISFFFSFGGGGGFDAPALALL